MGVTMSIEKRKAEIAREIKKLEKQLVDIDDLLFGEAATDYMRAAVAKGVSFRRAVWRHAFRNSMVPLANIIIPMFTNIMGGSMVVESIFTVPGIGGILVDSITVSDYSLALGSMLFYSFISVATILIVDISYGIIDPRIRLGAKK